MLDEFDAEFDVELDVELEFEAVFPLLLELVFVPFVVVSFDAVFPSSSAVVFSEVFVAVSSVKSISTAFTENVTKINAIEINKINNILSFVFIVNYLHKI